MKYSKIFPVLAIVLVSFSCAKKSADDSETKTETLQVSHLTSQISVDLQTVAKHLIPESLDDNAVAEEISKKLAPANTAKSSDDLCGDLGLFECQPKLLRFYSRYTKTNIILTKVLVDAAGKAIGRIKDGASGVHRQDGGEELHYNKVSSTEFEILTVNENGPTLFISAVDGVYKIQLNFANAKDADVNAAGVLENTIRFNGPKDWSLESTVDGLNCKDNDVAGPSKLRFHMKREGDFWKGKVMMYSVAAFADAESMTCENRHDLETGAAGVLYTDGVADKNSVKGALYVSGIRSDIETEDIHTYGLSAICDNSPELQVCKNGSTEIQKYFENYPNPFCMRSLKFSSEVEFDNDCHQYSSGLVTEPYGSSSDWMKPSELADLELLLPNSL